MLIFPYAGTFNDKSLSQQAKVVGWLILSRQFLQSHPGTHSLGIPVTTLHIMHFCHQQQSLVQVPGLEEKSEVNGLANTDKTQRKSFL